MNKPKKMKELFFDTDFLQNCEKVNIKMESFENFIKKYELYKQEKENGKNPISELYEVCMAKFKRNNIEFVFDVLPSSLYKAHAKFGEYSASGTGSSKNLAKTSASRILLQKIKEDIENSFCINTRKTSERTSTETKEFAVKVEPAETKVSTNEKGLTETKESAVKKEPAETKGSKKTKGSTETKESAVKKEPAETKGSKKTKGSTETKESAVKKEPAETKGSKKAKGSTETKVSNGTKVILISKEVQTDPSMFEPTKPEANKKSDKIPTEVFNYIGTLHEYCQSMLYPRPVYEYVTVEDEYECTARVQEYTATGKSIRKQESKQLASKNLLDLLKNI